MKKYSSTMKANYRHNSAKKSRRALVFAAGAIGVALLFPWLIAKVSAIVLYPFHATTVWIKTSDGVLPTYLRARQDLVAEVEALRTQIATESGTQTSIRRLLEENMQLRTMARAGESEERIIARVLARPDYLAYDLLQIDKGSDSGVVLGAPVYTGVDSVVGIVVSVSPSYAFVDLFTSPGFLSTAYIFGPNVFAPIEGVGGGIARVKLPQGVALTPGQIVILPGVSNGVYGEIVSVQNEPTQPEQYGYIAPPLSMNSLLYVSVGTESVESRTADEIDTTIRTMLRNSLRLSSTTIQTFSASTTLYLDETMLLDATTTTSTATDPVEE